AEARELSCAALRPFFAPDASEEPLEDPIVIDEIVSVTFEGDTAMAELWLSTPFKPSEMVEAGFAAEDGWRLCDCVRAPRPRCSYRPAPRCSSRAVRPAGRSTRSPIDSRRSPPATTTGSPTVTPRPCAMHCAGPSAPGSRPTTCRRPAPSPAPN